MLFGYRRLTIYI